MAVNVAIGLVWVAAYILYPYALQAVARVLMVRFSANIATLAETHLRALRNFIWWCAVGHIVMAIQMAAMIHAHHTGDSQYLIWALWVGGVPFVMGALYSLLAYARMRVMRSQVAKVMNID